MVNGFTPRNSGAGGHSVLVRVFGCAVAVCVSFMPVNLAAAAQLAPAAKPPVASAITPVAVFGDDQRRDLSEPYSALEGKIGMLYEQSTQTLCTAFCVAPGMVATAAHCLFQPKNNQLPALNDVTFRLSWGKTYLTSGIAGRHTPFTKHNVAVGTTAFKNEPPLSAPKDWAIIKLEKPICRFGYLKVESLTIPELVVKAKEKKVFQVAFHWDYEHWKLAYSEPCEVKRDFDQIEWRYIRQHFVNPDELLLHTCDTGSGSSGSPILYDPGLPNQPDTPVVVGINVGTYTRTRILLRQGRIFRRLKPDIIANTGVNGTTFARVVSTLEEAEIISSHQDMLRLQTGLQMRGYYVGSLDGQLGRTTRTAITNFESANGMALTGLPTQELLHRFGDEQVTPSHTLSTARGNLGDSPQIAPPMALGVQSPPLPERRPAIESNTASTFDPFTSHP